MKSCRLVKTVRISDENLCASTTPKRIFRIFARLERRRFLLSGNTSRKRLPYCTEQLLAASVERHNEAPGGVVEWLMAPVLKTGRPKGLVGSNPTPSAILFRDQKSAGFQVHRGWSTGDSNAVRPVGRGAQGSGAKLSSWSQSAAWIIPPPPPLFS
jgi:hypothetical protein